MSLRLVIHEGSAAPRRAPAVDQLLIGRGAECTLHIPDPSVSTRHARLVAEGSRLYIEDLGSHNKIVIEGGVTLSKGQRAELVAGMTLHLGRVRVVVEKESGPSTSTELPTLQQTSLCEPALEVTLQPTLTPPSQKRAPHPPTDDDSGGVTMVPAQNPAPPPPPPRPSPPVPAPAPERRPEPAVMPTPEPVGHKTDSQTLVPDAPNEALSAQAFFEGLRPTLVFDNEVCRRAVRIAPPRFTLGRSMGELAINHPMLSNPHAQIFFQAKYGRLFIEDKQSKNGTFVNGEAMIANRPRELPLHAHLRFGTVNALFWMEKNYDGESLEERRKGALAVLSAQKKLDKARLKAAEEEAKKQGVALEAALIVAGVIDVPTWCAALEQARFRAPDNTKSLKLAIALLVVVVLGLVAFLLLKGG